MLYINTKTLEYPVTFTKLKIIYNNVSFSTPPDNYGDYAKVFDGEVPAFTSGQYVEEGAPVLVDGRYQRTWVVYDYTAEQAAQRAETEVARAAMAIRRERDKLLAATDWRAASDLTMSNEWKLYRQALRDVTSQATFPTEVEWPTKPE